MMIKRILLLLIFLGTMAFAQAQQTQMLNVGNHSLEVIQAGVGLWFGLQGMGQGGFRSDADIPDYTLFKGRNG